MLTTGAHGPPDSGAREPYPGPEGRREGSRMGLKVQGLVFKGLGFRVWGVFSDSVDGDLDRLEPVLSQYSAQSFEA